MNLIKQEELANYIQKEINKYKKPENKNDEFKVQLMQKAYETPSSLWKIYAPTNKLKHEFTLIENKLAAQKWLREFQNKNETIQSVCEICYSFCLIRDGKKTNKIDESMLSQWKNVFESVLPIFSNELDKVIEKWNEWEKKNIEEKQSSIVKFIDSKVPKVKI